ncbi:N-6 DNA methylase [Natrialbaceae archaeon AArc-T1-2]|uniref:N-6 DNA methylase n=1 Tax=Natrialbaceae archaeon AArc-T1-2 TaxID=3053904 RepID=UPI00255A7AE3|nr:N-6 DNA methylase [Natrialbaceae archaeon AArc-T1-2]WIV67789.1 N-6 DNA methylase [Natrialbaceae archaeon AArc-T1-2]
MPAEFEFQARLFAALEDYIEAHDTDFEEPRGEEPTDSGAVDIYLPSTVREGVAIEVKKADVDPHSIDVIKQGHRYARDKGISLFVTANPNDVFLFRRTETATSITELERRHYDLRKLSLPDFIDELLADVVDIQQGEGEVFDFDDLIISRLRSFHTSIYPIYENLISETFDEDDEFQSLLVEWARENDYPHDYPGVEDTFRIAAQQYAYILMNRIVFYELVRGQDVKTESGLPLDPIYDGVTVEKLDEHLENCFESIMEEIDYEAIFKDDSGFFKAVPEDEHTKRRLHTFTKSIEQEPLRDINSDVVGQIYQELIPTEERKELGQFYTPREIGQILSRWAIDSTDDRFLDPCSGSGSITVEAYKQFDELNGLSHQEIIRRITAVDINKFPLHLTALNLATRNIHQPTNELFAYYDDFFHLDPDTKRHNSHRLGVGGTSTDAADEGEAIGTFDATAANPPYVRQEHLYPNREMYRKHLKRFGPSSKTPYYDGDKEIDGRSDLYCYFLTHVTQFLEERGKLAWIVPTKWMVADYGPSLQQFLYDHYKVEAVVGFRKRVFEDALVDTVLLMIERCDDVTERKNTETNFVRINEKMDPDDVIRVIDRRYNISKSSYMKIHSRPNYRTISVRQSHLMGNVGDKLHHYINAPALYTAVLEDTRTVELSSVADITRGKKTGANPIFILDEDDIKSRNIEQRFTVPAIKSVKEVDGYEHTPADAEKWMLDMHDYVEGVVSMSGIGGTSDTADRVTSSLRADGYDGVLSYLKWAEEQPSSSNSSLDTYDPWFNMGDLNPKMAPIVCPQAMDTHRFFFRTNSDVVASNRFLLVQPNAADSDLLLGLLNSSLTKIVIESHGRITGGGAVNLSGSDLRTLRVVDPDQLSDEQADRVTDAFNRLAAGDADARDDLDEVTIDVLDLDVTVDELQEVAETLKRTRREKGKQVETLIKELDELEGHIDMSFEDDSGRQEGLSSFSD